MKVRIVEQRPVTAFVLGLFAWSWGYWTLLGVTVGVESLSYILTMPGLWGAAISAVVVTWASGGSVRSFLGRTLRSSVRTRWFVVALVGPAVLGIVSSVAQVRLSDGTLELALFAPVVGLTVATFAGGSEEIGLRGFAHPRLRQRYGGVVAGFGIGLVWAVWHLPLHRLGVGFDGPFWLFASFVLPISVLLGWLYDAGEGSVIPAVLAHAGVDAPALLGASQISGDVVFTSRVLMTGLFWLLVVGLVAKNGFRLTSSSSLPGPAGDPADAVGNGAD